MTQRPPPRSRRAVFPHRALQEYSLPPSGLSPTSCRSFLRTPDNAWSLNGKGMEQCFASCPIIAPPLTPAGEPLEQYAHGVGEKPL